MGGVYGTTATAQPPLAGVKGVIVRQQSTPPTRPKASPTAPPPGAWCSVGEAEKWKQGSRRQRTPAHTPTLINTHKQREGKEGEQTLLPAKGKRTVRGAAATHTAADGSERRKRGRGRQARPRQRGSGGKAQQEGSSHTGPPRTHAAADEDEQRDGRG